MEQSKKAPEVRIVPQPKLELTPTERKIRLERSAAHFARQAVNDATEDGQEKRPPTILGGPLYLAPSGPTQGELDLDAENQKLF